MAMMYNTRMSNIHRLCNAVGFLPLSGQIEGADARISLANRLKYASNLLKGIERGCLVNDRIFLPQADHQVRTVVHDLMLRGVAVDRLGLEASLVINNLLADYRFLRPRTKGFDSINPDQYILDFQVKPDSREGLLRIPKNGRQFAIYVKGLTAKTLEGYALQAEFNDRGVLIGVNLFVADRSVESLHVLLNVDARSTTTQVKVENMAYDASTKVNELELTPNKFENVQLILGKESPIQLLLGAFKLLVELG